MTTPTARQSQAARPPSSRLQKWTAPWARTARTTPAMSAWRRPAMAAALARTPPMSHREHERSPPRPCSVLTYAPKPDVRSPSRSRRRSRRRRNDPARGASPPGGSRQPGAPRSRSPTRSTRPRMPRAPAAASARGRPATRPRARRGSRPRGPAASPMPRPPGPSRTSWISRSSGGSVSDQATTGEDRSARPRASSTGAYGRARSALSPPRSSPPSQSRPRAADHRAPHAWSVMAARSSPGRDLSSAGRPLPGLHATRRTVA